MAVKFLKKPVDKPAPQVQEQVQVEAQKPDAALKVALEKDDTLQPTIDRWLEIEAVMQANNIAALAKEQDSLAKVLRAHIKDKEYPNQEPVNFESEKGLITFTPCSKSTEIIDRGAMIQTLGQPVFNDIAKVTLGDLTQYLSEKEIAGFIKVSDTGPRKMKGVVAK